MTPADQPAGNRTFAVPLADGWPVEAVFYPTGTLCLSTQAGCAVGCLSRASGARGLHRNLTISTPFRSMTPSGRLSWPLPNQ